MSYRWLINDPTASTAVLMDLCNQETAYFLRAAAVRTLLSMHTYPYIPAPMHT